MKKIEYLFDPRMVEQSLSSFPQLAATMSNSVKHGQPAAISGVRKSAMNIFRWLDNYDFQSPILSKINNALESDWISKRDVCTQDSTEFESLLSEIDLMIYNKNSGYIVSRPKSSPDNHRADILLQKDGIKVCAEIYTPRSWNGFYAFINELPDYTMFMDVASNYSFSIWYDQIKRLEIKNGVPKLLNFNPFYFSDLNSTNSKRWDHISRILSELRMDSDERYSIDFTEANLRLRFKFSNLNPPAPRLFLRGYSYVQPGLSLPGNIGELMFEKLLHTSVKNKLRKRQAKSDIYTKSALIVDCSYLANIIFGFDWKIDTVKRSVANYVKTSSLAVDFLVFCRRDSESRINFLTVASKIEEPIEDVYMQLFQDQV